MHQAAAADLGLELHYVAMSVRPFELEQAISGLGTLGFRGANVTAPHKQAVMPFLDGIDPSAAAIGAVNTIVFSRSVAGNHGSATTGIAGTWSVGHNTDWSGFLADLGRLGVDIRGENCLVLGAGGSARAIVYGLASAGSRAHVFARRPAQAQGLVRDLSPHFAEEQLQAHDWRYLSELHHLSDLALIVNTTPVGMAPQVGESPWPADLPFPARAFVYDLVYNPADTEFMRQADAAGCRVANGLGMLVQQGARSFELWTGRKPNTEIMAAALA
jgi:shikimate dehydrogenase